MPWQDWVLIGGTFVALVEFFFIVGIYRDDHAMRLLTEEALAISRESLVAQREYLAFRRKWYESRIQKEKKPKEEKSAEQKAPQQQ